MKKYVRVNERITAKTVRLIGPEGNQLGIFPREIALQKAWEANLDLVEVASHSDPPVCRIMDFAKYKYEQEKREREVRKHQKHSQLKEIRFTPRIDSHDFQTKTKHVREFLEKGHKVRISIFFRGREMAHQEIGKNIINKLMEQIQDLGKIDKEPKIAGRILTVVIAPK